MSKKVRTPRVEERQWIASVLQMFLVAGGVLLAYHLFLAPATGAVASNAAPAAGVKVVDSKAVLGSFMEVMGERIATGEELTGAQLNIKGQDFAAEYMRAVKKYRDAGYLVIDKQYALGVPVGTDITQEIASALSLEVEPGVDPFSAPELE